ncbi:MAG: hypothetical protein JNL72_12940 [Flavipsychrobacter sp.]|nr:hypothetical protein [Flavipsychrobacter sp.]
MDRNYTLLLCLSLAFLFSSCRKKQGETELPVSPYTTESFNAQAMRAIKCADGTYAVAGRANNGVALTRITETRQLIWTKVIPAGDMVFNDFAETEDGGFLLVGEMPLPAVVVIGQPYQRVLAAKVDKHGGMEWVRMYGDSLLHSPQPIVTRTSDNNYMVLSRRAVPGWDGCVLTKIRSDGDTAWQRFIDKKAQAVSAGILETKDHNYLAAIRYTDGVTKSRLYKVTGQGDSLWSKQVDAGGDLVSMRGITETANGEIVAYGRTSGSRSIVAKLSANAEQLWRLSFGTDTVDELLTYLREDDRGGYIATGQAGGQTSGFTKYSATLVSISQEGELVWQRRYEEATSTFGISVFPQRKGYYLFGGKSEQTGARTFYVKYTNEEGGSQ